MGADLDRRAAITELIRNVSQAFSNEVKALIETKHVYQRVRMDPRRIVADVRARISANEHQWFDTQAQQTIKSLRFTPSREESWAVARDESKQLVPFLLLTNVKLFCSACDEREVATPVWFTDISNEIAKRVFIGGSTPKLPPDYQLFVLSYQCQRCEGPLTSFLVRRDAWLITVDGRSPFEEVAVPKFLPKPEQRLFRDALVAIHGGKVLAGLFYLRTFIEQFVRRQTGVKGKLTGEAIMKQYSEGLPKEHRDQMPSLGDWYERLSGALHEAREDEVLFEQARQAIEKHFDIRRVFEIPEVPGVTNGSGT